MKIAIYVDYKNAKFNNDFSFSNDLIKKGHTVFLVINDEQLKYYEGKVDYILLGESKPNLDATLSNLMSIEEFLKIKTFM